VTHPANNFQIYTCPSDWFYIIRRITGICNMLTPSV